jgi:transcription elongation factor GreA
MSNINYVTAETLEKMRTELQRMKAVDRPAASAAIAEAREKGDLKENAEYDAAKEAQGHLEDKIKQLEAAIATTRILSEDSIDTSKVGILTTVTITNMGLKKTFTYKLVSESEANIKEQKISITSPIGKGLIGKKVGDVAEIQTPGGLMKFTIDNITV